MIFIFGHGTKIVCLKDFKLISSVFEKYEEALNENIFNKTDVVKTREQLKQLKRELEYTGCGEALSYLDVYLFKAELLTEEYDRARKANGSLVLNSLYFTMLDSHTVAMTAYERWRSSVRVVECNPFSSS